MAYKGYRCKICGGKTTEIDQGLTQCRKCGAITMKGTSWNKIIKGGKINGGMESSTSK